VSEAISDVAQLVIRQHLHCDYIGMCIGIYINGLLLIWGF